MSSKKFTIEEKFLGKKITGKNKLNVCLTENTSQKDLKKLYNAGFKHVVKVEEIKNESEDKEA